MRPTLVLIVEDERVLARELSDSLADMGYSIDGPCLSLSAGIDLAWRSDCDVALLDINLGGELVFPVADILEARHVPFVFFSASSRRLLPEKYANRPLLEKPAEPGLISKALAQVI